MNELFFNWHKRLNFKKVAIAILVIVTIILLILLLKILTKESDNQDSSGYIYNPETNTTTFFDKNHSISLDISNTYGLKQYTPTNDYLIELRSDGNLDIFVSFKEAIKDRTFKDIVEADKLAFTENFSTISNQSELKEISINGNTGYTYSFHYLDENLNTNFYLQITWLKIDGNYYIFDIEFPLDNLELYTSIVTDVLSNFHKNN